MLNFNIKIKSPRTISSEQLPRGMMQFSGGQSPLARMRRGGQARPLAHLRPCARAALHPTQLRLQARCLTAKHARTFVTRMTQCDTVDRFVNFMKLLPSCK